VTNAEEGASTIPVPRRSASPYLRVVELDDVAYLNGQLPYLGETIPYAGTVGHDVSLEEAQECARLCALNVLGVIKHELGGLERVRQVLRITGYVSCIPGFEGLPAVMDAASAVFIEHLGEQGRHARSAIGVAALPRNSPVEIEVTVALHGAERAG
jgi:enamine deaminase RidA (YjgF/YER057c/UK114 family)